MGYYDALVIKWNSLAPDTTANKLAAINSLMITGSVPASFYITGDQLLNCINWTEFNALTTTQQINLMGLCRTPGQILGGSSNTTHMAPGMFLASFTVTSQTISALTGLAKATAQPWWQVSVANGGGGLSSAVGMPDLLAAGGLT